MAWLIRASSEGSWATIEESVSVGYLSEARALVNIIYVLKVALTVSSKLVSLAPVVMTGCVENLGCLRKGLSAMLGVSKLQVLLPNQHLAALVMPKTQKQNHDGPQGTLAGSQGLARIHQGDQLSRRIERKCIYWEAETEEQKEGVAFEQPPVATNCLLLLGPAIKEGAI